MCPVRNILKFYFSLLRDSAITIKLEKFEIDLKIYVHGNCKIFATDMRLAEVTKIFKQSIIYYVNKLRYLYLIYYMLKMASHIEY